MVVMSATTHATEVAVTRDLNMRAYSSLVDTQT
jgi:hypothetical protein